MVIRVSLLASALLFLGLPPTRAAGMRCPAEGEVRSAQTSDATTIDFVNETSSGLRVFWVDFDGRRRFYADIDVGHSLHQATFMGHVWVLTDDEENCLNVVVAEPKPNVVRMRN